MPPEQAKGKSADRRSDIWSFGVVVYELLVGRTPFEGDNTVEILGAVINKEPDWSACCRRARSGCCAGASRRIGESACRRSATRGCCSRKTRQSSSACGPVHEPTQAPLHVFRQRMANDSPIRRSAAALTSAAVPSSIVWVYDLQLDTATQLTFTGSVGSGIAWARDSKHIVYRRRERIMVDCCDGSGQPHWLLDKYVQSSPMSSSPRTADSPSRRYQHRRQRRQTSGLAYRSTERSGAPEAREGRTLSR